MIHQKIVIRVIKSSLLRLQTRLVVDTRCKKGRMMNTWLEEDASPAGDQDTLSLAVLVQQNSFLFHAAMHHMQREIRRQSASRTFPPDLQSVPTGSHVSRFSESRGMRNIRHERGVRVSFASLSFAPRTHQREGMMMQTRVRRHGAKKGDLR